MTDIINIRIERTDGALQRLIGLVERRGFHIDAIDMASDDAALNIALTVRGRDAGRSVDNLGLQIDRLFGARRIFDDAGFRAEAA
jgi:acetolactate synthase II small subunit